MNAPVRFDGPYIVTTATGKRVGRYDTLDLAMEARDIYNPKRDYKPRVIWAWRDGSYYKMRQATR